MQFADEVWKRGSADGSMEAPMEVWKCVRKGRMGWPFSATVTEEDNDDDDDDEEYDDTKIEKLHIYERFRRSSIYGFSRGKPEAGRNELGLCTARYEPKCYC